MEIYCEINISRSEIFCECEELVKLWEVTDDKDVKYDILKIILDNYQASYNNIINPIVLRISYVEKQYIKLLSINLANEKIYNNKILYKNAIERRFKFDEKFNMFRFGPHPFSYVMDKTLYNKFIHLLNLSD